MLNNEDLKQELEKSPAPRVTEEQIHERIADVEYHRLNETVTLCSITLDNGYSVRGEAACVNPDNYNEEIGRTYAYKTAFGKLWPLFGFLLAEDQFRAKKSIDENIAGENPEQSAAA